MKYLIIILVLITLTACASVPFILAFNERRWRLASAIELGNERAGKAVFRYCSRTSWLGYCKEYKLEVQNLCEVQTHDKFLNAGFVLYPENKLK
jgi:hypothetical protein